MKYPIVWANREGAAVLYYPGMDYLPYYYVNASIDANNTRCDHKFADLMISVHKMQKITPNSEPLGE